MVLATASSRMGIFLALATAVTSVIACSSMRRVSGTERRPPTGILVTAPTPPTGPAFHSAGPRTIADPDHADAAGDDEDAIAVTGAADAADESESSDEAATA